MKLVVHELESDGLIQTISSSKNVILYAIRPHIYRHNFPTGSLKIQLLDNADSVLSESETINIADIGTEDYLHGYIRFLISYGITKNTTYKVKLVGGDGYAFNESAYIGWCNGFDLGKYDPAYESTTAYTKPLDLEIWERKVK